MAMNVVIVEGNLGDDPKTSKLQDGTSVTNISLAVTERWTKEGQKREHTEWFRVCLFGPVADIAAQYLRKGDKALVRGRLRTRKWTDNSGTERWSTEVIVDRGGQLDLITPKSDTPRGDDYRRQSSGDLPPNDLDDEIPF